MADETLETQEEQKTLEQVADEAIKGGPQEETAQNTAAKEEKAEEQKTEQKEEPEDHAERSRLGRKVSAIDKQLQAQNAQFNTFLERFDALLGQMGQTRQAQPQKEEEPDDGEEIILTKKQLKDYVKNELSSFTTERQKTETAKVTKYATDYLKTLGNMKDSVSEEEFSEIYELCSNSDYQNPYNKQITGNAVVDAQLNFSNAVNGILRKRLAQGGGQTKENPLKGKTPSQPLGPTVNTKTAQREVAMPKLSKDAQEYLDYIRSSNKKLTDEDIGKALKGNSPASLGLDGQII